MALMRTSNPALNAKTFADVRRDPTAPSMTVEGTVNRTAFLLFLVVLPAAWVWAQVRTALDPSVAGPWIMVGAIGGLVVAFITISSTRSEEHTSELQSQSNLVCRLLLEKKKKYTLPRARVRRERATASIAQLDVPT